MKLSELRQEVRDLAFEDDAQMTEYADIFLNAVDRSIKEIHSFDIHRLSSFTITQNGTLMGSTTYDPRELVNDFSRLTNNVYIVQDGNYKKFNDYLILGEDNIILDGSVIADFVFEYERKVGEVNETDDLDIGYDAESMLPLLVAHYVWLDDDETKAYDYYNLYLRRRDIYEAEQNNRANDKATVVTPWEVM